MIGPSKPLANRSYSSAISWADFPAPIWVNAPPITYEIDGEQYVAVAAGGNQIWGYKQGDSVLVFKLGKKEMQ